MSRPELIDDARVVAAAMLKTSTAYRGQNSYNPYYECRHCDASIHEHDYDAGIPIKHDLSCPTLIAKDLLA